MRAAVALIRACKLVETKAIVRQRVKTRSAKWLVDGDWEPNKRTRWGHSGKVRLWRFLERSQTFSL